MMMMMMMITIIIILMFYGYSHYHYHYYYCYYDDDGYYYYYYYCYQLGGKPAWAGPRARPNLSREHIMYYTNISLSLYIYIHTCIEDMM